MCFVMEILNIVLYAVLSIGNDRSSCKRIYIINILFWLVFLHCLVFWCFLAQSLTSHQMTNIPTAHPATGLKNENHKEWDFFSLLRKLLAKHLVNTPPTMVSADYCSGTPLLPTMPFPGRNDSEWSWLIDVCLGTGWGAPRRPWDDGGHHGWKVCLVFILLVFCALFYMDAIAIIAENRLKSIINDDSL